MKKISVIIPCYNEEETLPHLFKKIMEQTHKLQCVKFEILFVDDGSEDKTLTIIKQFSALDDSVKYISFSRNFGKEAAIYAGLRNSTGDFVAIMDADLQDPPELLLEMYKIITNENYDCVATRRATRNGEPIVRSLFAKLFYKIINKMSDVDIVDGARDYRMMNRKMVNAILQMCEYNRFSKGIFSWVGFKTKWLSYDNVERIAGKTKWSFWKLFKYSLEGITAFSTTPLVLAAVIGTLFCLISFAMIVVIIIKTLAFGDPTTGWPSMACIMFMVGGIQLFCIGIIGQYLSKTYLETKNRPLYIVNEKGNINDEK